MNRYLEKLYPALVATIFGVLSFWLGADFDSKKLADQLSSGINISAILMGFLGTAKAMLLSFNSEKYIELKNHKAYWDLLISYFQSAMLANIALCLYSITLFSLDLETLKVWPGEEFPITAILQPIWIFLATLSFLLFYRVMRIIFSLLKT